MERSDVNPTPATLRPPVPLGAGALLLGVWSRANGSSRSDPEASGERRPAEHSDVNPTPATRREPSVLSRYRGFFAFKRDCRLVLLSVVGCRLGGSKMAPPQAVNNS